MEHIYEAVIELSPEKGNITLPELPSDVHAYAKDTWTGKRIPLNLNGVTKLPEGQVQWSIMGNLLAWHDVEPARFTVFVVRAYTESQYASEEAQESSSQ